VPDGHFAEAQVLQSLGVDYVDESEVLTPADESYHVESGRSPFVRVRRDEPRARRCAASARAPR